MPAGAPPVLQDAAKTQRILSRLPDLSNADAKGRLDPFAARVNDRDAVGAVVDPRRGAVARHFQDAGSPVKIHEYQAKAILARHGVPVPRGEVAFSAAEAGAIARRLGGGVVVVKAQIHAGGRGKGGGVKVVKDANAAEETAKQILGMTLVTHQTGPEGRLVERVLIEEGADIVKELYLGLLIDRAAGCPVLMASSEGGMDIEEVAAHSPDKIKKVYISPVTGLTAFQARQLAFGIGLAPEHVNKAVKVMLADLRRVHRHRCVAHRDQPAHRHRRWQRRRARREGDLRRQRALPAPGVPRPARPGRGRPARDRGQQVLAELHPPRRHDRLHGQRRRPRDGDDGHHQAGGRRAGQLPRRRRRRQRRADYATPSRS